MTSTTLTTGLVLAVLAVGASALFAPVYAAGKGRPGGGGLSYSCSGLQCTCTGDADCNDMFSSGVCGDIASCNNDVCKCLILKRAPKSKGASAGQVRGSGMSVIKK